MFFDPTAREQQLVSMEKPQIDESTLRLGAVCPYRVQMIESCEEHAEYRKLHLDRTESNVDQVGQL